MALVVDNSRIQDMLHKRTWQDLEAAEHNHMDHILGGDIHNSQHSIGSGLAEAACFQGYDPMKALCSDLLIGFHLASLWPPQLKPYWNIEQIHNAFLQVS